MYLEGIATAVAARGDELYFPAGHRFGAVARFKFKRQPTQEARDYVFSDLRR